MEELVRLGVTRVPAVTYGGGVVHGWNPEGYARLVGVEYTEARKLPPRELGRRLDAILAATQELTRVIPAERMGWKPPSATARSAISPSTSSASRCRFPTRWTPATCRNPSSPRMPRPISWTARQWRTTARSCAVASEAGSTGRRLRVRARREHVLRARRVPRAHHVALRPAPAPAPRAVRPDRPDAARAPRRRPAGAPAPAGLDLVTARPRRFDGAASTTHPTVA